MASNLKYIKQGQEKEIKRIFRNQAIKYLSTIVTFFAVVFGWSVWETWAKVETMVADQFKEPRIQEVVKEAASEKASTLLTEQVNPEVAKFKDDVAKQMDDIQTLVTTTEQQLKAQTSKNKQSIQDILTNLQNSLKQSKEAQATLVSVRSDIAEMQKYIATLQYYEMKAHPQVPDPYMEKRVDLLNKLTVIAFPDIKDRRKFAAELEKMGIEIK